MCKPTNVVEGVDTDREVQSYKNAASNDLIVLKQDTATPIPWGAGFWRSSVLPAVVAWCRRTKALFHAISLELHWRSDQL
jgi:hypothetical protein